MQTKHSCSPGAIQAPPPCPLQADRGETTLQWALDSHIGFPPQNMELPSHFPFWKLVATTLRKERKLWQTHLAEEAGKNHWHAFRVFKAQDRHQSNWAAALLADPHWASKLSSHMTGIFAKTLENETREAMVAMRHQATALCKLRPWRPFTEEEMRIRMSIWKNRRPELMI